MRVYLAKGRRTQGRRNTHEAHELGARAAEAGGKHLREVRTHPEGFVCVSCLRRSFLSLPLSLPMSLSNTMLPLLKGLTLTVQVPTNTATLCFAVSPCLLAARPFVFGKEGKAENLRQRKARLRKLKEGKAKKA